MVLIYLQLLIGPKNGTGGNMEINETNGLCAHESSVCVDMNSNGWGYAAFPVDLFLVKPIILMYD